ncbi:aldehyde dehydrogenase family protein [Rhodococcus aetherivorans]|uniref:aldehyde dehydrogenase family protein n=1 Tax=Rhodococcus aetherivorans TaxID=191292 RepID=UPI0002D2494D|nr:aldehyde dehydrogenase family protein [Rhodococcus aetherivorans]AKE88367.1 sorbosone dehydrogenase [Rhodococcus aetherivorans]CCW14777.1 Aldehyde dehydrogenase [Rhodococcus aetherivorans]
MSTVEATDVRNYGHYIGGQSAPPSQQTIERVSPADGRVVATFSAGRRSDALEAISVARRAFDAGDWPRRTAMERGRVLLRCAALMAENAEHLARIDAEESGKPITLARGDVGASIELFEYAAALAMTIHGEAHTALGDDCTALVVREPAGVVGMIIPWNFPLLLLAQKLPFALGAGCTAVVKPSEFTSGSAIELARLLSEAGVPDGAVNVVTGVGSAVGAPLAESREVDILSFTGSTETGRRIVEASAGSVKRLSMELGGKAASVVFEDADLDDALDGVLFGVFFNQGECCVSGARLLVQDSIADAFLERLVEAASRIAVGGPLDDASELGPMIDSGHLEKVLGHIETARRDGAEVLTGGERLTGSDWAEGHFVGPTILDGVREDSAAFQEEIFGPVLTVTRFRDVDDAIRLANATEYGLAGSIWTKNIDKALRVAKEMRSGRVWVNTTIDGAPQLPAGGMKQSGFGREMGQAGFDEFTDVKTIQIRTGARKRVFPQWTGGQR